MSWRLADLAVAGHRGASWRLHRSASRWRGASTVSSPRPILSSDVYRYVWDGRVEAAGINPYRYVPADPQLAPLRDPDDLSADQAQQIRADDLSAGRRSDLLRRRPGSARAVTGDEGCDGRLRGDRRRPAAAAAGAGGPAARARSSSTPGTRCRSGNSPEAAISTPRSIAFAVAGVVEPVRGARWAHRVGARACAVLAKFYPAGAAPGALASVGAALGLAACRRRSRAAMVVGLPAVYRGRLAGFRLSAGLHAPRKASRQRRRVLPVERAAQAVSRCSAEVPDIAYLAAVADLWPVLAAYFVFRPRGRRNAMSVGAALLGGRR